MLTFVTVTAQILAAPQTLSDADAAIRHEHFADAQSILKRLAESDPENVEYLYRLGYVLYRERDLAGARKRFETVVRLAPPALYSRYFLGRIALLENHPRDAMNWLEPAANAKEAVLDAASQFARALEANGYYERAATYLQKAIAHSPWDSALHYRLGRVYQKLGKAELARDSLETSQRMKDADVRLVALIQECAEHVTKRERTEAVRVRDTILKAGVPNPDALVAVGVLLGDAGWQEDALVAFERAAANNPSLFQAQYNYGLALVKLSRLDEAFSPLRKAVTLLPQSADANAALGLLYVMRRQFSDAVPVLVRANDLAPENTKVATLLALAYIRTDAAEKAIPLLRTLVKADGADVQPYLLLVEALNAKEDTAAALAVAEDARRRFPESPQAHMAAAQQLVRVGRYADAGPVFARVAELAPNYADALLGWGDALQKSGEHARAAEVYARAVSAAPDLLGARLGLARSLVSQRKFDEARQTLEEALAAHADDKQLHLELSRVYARLGKPELAAEQSRILERLNRQNAP